MRGIKDRFIGELQSGKLAWLLEAVKTNDALLLSIEQNYINLFYKGNNLMEVKPGGGYTFIIDEKYFTTDPLKEEYAIFNRDKKAAGVYQRKLPVLLEAMDTSYGATCHPHDQDVQVVASKTPFVVGMHYKIPASCGEGVLDMIGVEDGKLIVLQHNRSEAAQNLVPAYESLGKIWADPAEKEKLVNSVNTMSTNMAALGLRSDAPQITQDDVTFVAVLADSAPNPDVKTTFSGMLEAKLSFVDGADGVVDLSKAL